MISTTLKGAWLSFALCVAGVVGCNTLIGANDPILREEDSSVGQACVLNSDCSMVGQYCIFRVCSPPCHTDGDCSGGSRCLQTQMGTACVSNAVAACSSGQPCPGGSFCQTGFCRNTCDVARACLSGQQCMGGACVGSDPAHDPGIDAGTEAGLDATALSDAVDDRTVQVADASDAVADAVQDNAVAIDDRGNVAGDATTDALAEAGCGDTTSDVQHCGACDRDCTKLPNVSAAGLACSGGHCVYQCAAGHADCADAGAGCQTDLSMSPNCGACGTTCPAAAALCAPAMAGGFSCQSGCPSSAPIPCGMACVNTTNNSANCGACGMACTTSLAHAVAQCVASLCTTTCAATYTSCSGACVDLTSDDNNCNTCGNQCTGGRHCVSGACQCTGGTHLCGSQCVANDTSACGPSCSVCVAPTGGTVTCNGTQCAQSCTTGGDTVCSNVCVNETNDPANCGLCARACTPSTPFCVNSACVECTSGTQCGPSNTPQACVGNQWVNQTPCSAPTPVCSSGSCVQCTSGTQCDSTNTWVQSCVGNMWQNQTMCASGTQICRSASCVNSVHDVGWDTALSQTFALSANYMYLFRLPQLSHSATVLGFGIYGTATTTGHAKMAVYADDGTGLAPTGPPLDWIGTYLTLSSSQVQTGANTSGPLSASTYYWLGIDVDTATQFYSQPSSGVAGNGFPQTYGTYPNGMAGSMYPIQPAIYINVRDIN